MDVNWAPSADRTHIDIVDEFEMSIGIVGNLHHVAYSGNEVRRFLGAFATCK